MKDFLGKEFKVGQTIVYPVRYSSSMYMHKAVITAIGDHSLAAIYHRKPWREEEFIPSRKVTIYRLDRVTIVAD